MEITIVETTITVLVLAIAIAIMLSRMSSAAAETEQTSSITKRKISPMMESAVASNQIESIKCLKELGFDLEAKNNEGRTPIFGAAMLGNIESIKCLKELGANVNAVDNAGLTPIFVAAMAGQVASIECLVKLGADINAKERNDCSPIFLATFVGQTESMKCLKKLGADLNVIAGNGMNLMEAAKAAGHSEDSEVFRVLKSLLGTDEKVESSSNSVFIDPRDGKKYKTVTIGKQTWMAENLNYEASSSKVYDYSCTNGMFQFVGSFAGWLSSTEEDSENVYYRNVGHEDNDVFKYSIAKTTFFSVRCIKD